MHQQDSHNEIIFVRRMVKQFTDRFVKKLAALAKPICQATLIVSHGSAAMQDASATVTALEQEARAASERYRVASGSFATEFGTELLQITDKAIHAEGNRIEGLMSDFKFKIHKAIGLVELVNGEAAFEVLEERRQFVEDFGKPEASE